MILISNKKLQTITFFLISLLLSSSVYSWDREKTKNFALLPHNSVNPEAITADDHGNIYVSTFFGGEVHQFSAKGELSHSIVVTPSSGTLTDLAFQPLSNILLVIDFGGQKVLQVDPVTGNATTFAEIPGGASAGPNVLTFDSQANVYVSDSFQGTIWRIPAAGGIAEPWITHAFLSTSGFPPFGANGLAFNKNYSKMYVANTGEDSIVEIAVDDQGNAGEASILVNSINGPDGLIVDEDDNILVAANQSNQIIVLDPTGKATAVLGDFDGINEDGIVEGLLFPSDLVKVGNDIYVTNFAIDLDVFGLVQAYTSQYTRQVKRYSVARIKLDKEDD